MTVPWIYCAGRSLLSCMKFVRRRFAATRVLVLRRVEMHVWAFHRNTLRVRFLRADLLLEPCGRVDGPPSASVFLRHAIDHVGFGEVRNPDVPCSPTSPPTVASVAPQGRSMSHPTYFHRLRLVLRRSAAHAGVLPPSPTTPMVVNPL